MTKLLFCSCVLGFLAHALAQDLFLASSVTKEEAVLPFLSTDVCHAQPEPVSRTVANQGKFAVWHEELKVLLYVDSPAFTQSAWEGSIVYAYRPTDGSLHELWRDDKAIVGSVMPRKVGGIALAISWPVGDDKYRSSLYTMDLGADLVAGKLTLRATLPADTKGKFNNGNCDPMGRYWLGTFDYGHEQEYAAKVWVWEQKDGKDVVRVGIEGIGHPNGLLWNTAGDKLTFSETFLNRVVTYKYDVNEGKVVGDAQVLIEHEGSQLLDSLCGTKDGHLLVSMPGLGQLGWYDESGKHLCDVKVPTASNFVASCAFTDKDLYIPTGRNGGGSSGPAGWLFRIPGLPAGGAIMPTPCDV